MKDGTVFVVFWEGKLLIVIEDVPFATRDTVLDWYAQEYAFDRCKLSGAFVHTISAREMAA